MAFSLPPLPYPADALEAAIDKTTMEIHHDKHHKAYVDNLNKALENQPQLQSRSLVQLLSDIKSVPEGIRQAVINNGGGTINHNMFWEIMGPKGGGEPTGPLAEAIRSTFNDFAGLKQKIKETGLARFGSGWSWLVLSGGKLQILSSANQDSPYMNGQVPILGVDVWEHAYYLRYQNRRADYLDAWWKVVNWDAIGKRFAEAQAGKLTNS
jgi:Fe-Mn family superoxide dismutase